MSNTPDNIRNMWEQAALEEGNSKKHIGTDRDNPFRASNLNKQLTSAAWDAREKRREAEKEAEKEAERAKKPAGG